jgi:hypothetical protein
MADKTRKLTCYQLQEAIRRWELKKTSTTKQFDESLWAFEGEDKASPVLLGETFQKVEEAVSRLQTLQARYNLSVIVDVSGAKMTLCEAVKRVGGAVNEGASPAGGVNLRDQCQSGGASLRHGGKRSTTDHGGHPILHLLIPVPPTTGRFAGPPVLLIFNHQGLLSVSGRHQTPVIPQSGQAWRFFAALP